MPRAYPRSRASAVADARAPSPTRAQHETVGTGRLLSSSPLRILFVDNHPEFTRSVIEQFLDDHEVVIAATISAARELASRGAFDVFLVDYDLDDGKGDELVGWLRAAGSHVKIIAISARDTGNAALVAAGADAVCRKLDFARIGALL